METLCKCNWNIIYILNKNNSLLNSLKSRNLESVTVHERSKEIFLISEIAMEWKSLLLVSSSCL